jgi:nitrite reductase (NO-forming)
MTIEEESPIIRTTASRLGKGIAIILVVMAVAAAIHIAFNDVWSKYPPVNQVAKASTSTAPTTPTPATPAVGESRTFNLVFHERTPTDLYFTVDGQENADIIVNVGDKITINIKNEGNMPHSFGIVTDPNDFNSIAFTNANIGSSTQFLLSKQEGTTTFIADKPGEYYYICLVAGHADLGMKGKFIVKERSTGSSGAGSTSTPVVGSTGNKVEFNLTFEEESPVKLYFTVNGEINKDIRVKAGDTVTIKIKNNGNMPHSFGIVTDPNDFNSIAFTNANIGSSTQFLLSKQEGTTTFIADKPGEYYYICLVAGHADLGMKGKFIVE